MTISKSGVLFIKKKDTRKVKIITMDDHVFAGSVKTGVGQ